MQQFIRHTILIACIVFVVPIFAQASTISATSTTNTFIPTVSPPSGLTSCFSVYRFGSVVSSLAPSLSEVTQSAPLNFTGTIQNQNSYPIDDATLYIKIFHDRTDGRKDINGPDVVDWFPAVEHITLKAHETKHVSFTWDVPPDAQPGTYEAATYISASDRFEMYGLSFTDDITGSMTRFSVVGTNTGAIRFDKNSVSVNHVPFYFASFPPIISSSTQDVPVSAIVENTKDITQTATVDWKLYYWDALQKSHLLNESVKNVNLQPHATTTLTYVIKNTSHSVYYLIGTLTDQYGSKSIIGVRYARVGVNEPRFNFVGVSAYPAQKGNGEAIACIHSTGVNGAENSKITITAKTNEFISFLSSTIAHSTWSGDITGGMVALVAPFTKASKSFTLTAKLYQHGTLVDTITLPYSCNTLGVPCSMSLSEKVFIAIAIFMTLIAIGISIYFIRRWKNKKQLISS